MKIDKFGNLKGINMQASLDKLSNDLRNPMLIHKIEDALKLLPTNNFFCMAIKFNIGQYGFEEAINNIIDAHQHDNKQAVEASIGIETWNWIKEYKGIK